jgi:hypothetical protein
MVTIGLGQVFRHLSCPGRFGLFDPQFGTGLGNLHLGLVFALDCFRLRRGDTDRHFSIGKSLADLRSAWATLTLASAIALADASLPRALR